MTGRATTFEAKSAVYGRLMPIYHSWLGRRFMVKDGTVAKVAEFWGTEACGTHFVRDFADDREFYDKFREYRYRTEWHLPILVRFAQARGKKVLEIGTGNGADGVMFAQNGADYTGVDLTEAALEATHRHFTVLGLSGSFQSENAEALSFPDETFDWVYSHGVLHHTPSTQRAIDEVWRVLKRAGRSRLPDLRRLCHLQRRVGAEQVRQADP